MFATSPVHTVCGSQQHQILFVDGIARLSVKLLWMSDLLATTGLMSTCPQIFTDNIAMKIHEGDLCHHIKFVMFALLQSFPHFVILPYSAHLIYNLSSSFTFDFLQRNWRRMQGSGFCEGVVNPTLMFKVQMSKFVQYLWRSGIVLYKFGIRLYMKVIHEVPCIGHEKSQFCLNWESNDKSEENFQHSEKTGNETGFYF
jgi:hypothetical protein